MSVNGKVTVALCALGVVGSLFVGYCVYFDRKRRSHPDYKKKVRERRLSARDSTSKKLTIDLRDPKQREEFMVALLEQSNQCMMDGNLEQAVMHLVQFVQVSGDPRTALNNLQRIVPPAIFNLVVQGFAAMAEAKLQQHQQQKQETLEASELD